MSYFTFGNSLKFSALWCLFQLVSSAPTFPQFEPCPILGSIFQAPVQLSKSDAISEGLDLLRGNLTESTKTGILADNVVTPNTTSFSISLFSVEDSSDKPFFFDFHWTAPSHGKSGTGVETVDANTIYRIGSLTQVFNVWAFLIEAGEGHWHESVTKYIPELAKVVKENDPKSNPVAYVDWDDVTLGDLAGHLAGISRDCKAANLFYNMDFRAHYLNESR